MIITNEKDAEKVARLYLISISEEANYNLRVADLGSNWYNVFYSGDEVVTIGPNGKIYNIECGIWKSIY